MPDLRLILGDQLSRSISSLQGATPGDSVILMAEVMTEATYVRHHKKKIAFLFSAMRHFAEALRTEGFNVRYVALEDEGNSQSLTGEVARAIEALQPDQLVVTECGEYRLAMEMFEWHGRFTIPVDVREDDRFLSSVEDFRRFAEGRRQLRMEYFYREMRRRHGILLDDKGEPEGGQWNFDQDNRKPPPAGLSGPPRKRHPKDAITRDVLALVARRFGGHIGTLEPFHFAVTAEEAEEELDHFIETCLPRFGDYQDAMVKGEPYLYHSLISAYLNAGLLDARSILRKAEAAYRAGRAPLNAAEGFIRQILGWREYVRGLYWHAMPGYATRNALSADRPLPALYWTGKTKMACLAAAVGDTIEHAYSHHIQRLMVTGNFALIAGLDPDEVSEWYLAVYADAYQWVEMPNTRGMALFADGGMMGSKPYAASGKYIDRMSNFCKGCHYDPKPVTEPNACPFNALYWDFLARNEEVLARNARLAQPYASWRRMTPERQREIRQKAAETLAALAEDRL